MSTSKDNLPTVFAAPGMISDMSIEVSEQVFLVNSTILKAHSEYFRNYLDSPDKVAAAGALFKYDWVTQVDEDGSGWSLTAKEKVHHDRKAAPFTGKPEEQIEGFKTILSAMHSWPINISSARQLCLVAELADFYRLLLLMSNVLYGVFFSNPELVGSIPNHCVELLEASFKLRNKLLFRECFVHVMGPWNNPRFMNLTEPKLKNLAVEAQKKLTSRIMDVQIEQIALTIAGPLNVRGQRATGSDFGYELAVATSRISQDGLDSSGKPFMPCYYRNLYDYNFKTHGLKLKEVINPLLKNVLVLDRSGVQAGQGVYKDAFLFFELTEMQLPWDVNQRVW